MVSGAVCINKVRADFSRELLLFPTPASIQFSEEKFQIDKNTTILYDLASKANAEFLKNELSAVGIDVVAKKSRQGLHAYNAIILNRKSNAGLPNRITKALENEEVYTISVSNQRALIRAAGLEGQLYGILTFLQLLDPGNRSIPTVEISDWPKMTFRGLRGHFPKKDAREIMVFQGIIRAMTFCRLNQLWIRDLYARRFPASLQLDSHPEISDADAIPKTLAKKLIQFATEHNVKIMGSIAATAGIIWSIHPELIEMGPNERPETLKIKDEMNRTSKYRFGSRFNLCPSQEGTYRLLFDLIDEMAPMFTSEIFDLGVDEIGQEYNGSRWVADEFCKGKDPVKLFANYVNRLADYVSSKGKIPLVNSEPFIKQHGGSFHNIYKSVGLIRKNVIINNWSEGHVRSISRGWFNRLSKFESTAYFRKFGLSNIIHMVSAKGRWEDRPELLEKKGDLDCYGAFITHYSYLTGPNSVSEFVVDGMAYSSNHFWTPNVPEMNSKAERTIILYSKAVIKSILKGKSFAQAASDGRAEVMNIDED